MGPESLRSVLTKSGIFSISPRSNGAKCTDPVPDWPAASMAAASWSTTPRPRPRLPPVTTTLADMAGDLPRRIQLQRGDEANRRGNFVRGEPLPADLQDLPFEIGPVVPRVLLQDDVGRDQ